MVELAFFVALNVYLGVGLAIAVLTYFHAARYDHTISTPAKAAVLISIALFWAGHVWVYLRQREK